jgi:ABC-2 type transport system permease protein
MQALRVTYALWLREVKLFLRERTRIIGMIGQPLLYLLIFGWGISSALRFNQEPDLNYVLFLYPGILGMSVLFTSIFSGISIIWDREFGFLKEVLVAPAPRWAVAGGKVLGGATVATVQSAILLVLAPLAGVYPTPLMVLELLLLCFLLSCAMTSLGVAIAARMRSMQGFQMVMNFLVMPLYFLSGAIFPVKQAPAVMQPLMVLDPLTYGVDALRIVVMSGTPTSASPAALMLGNLYTDVAVMVLVAVVLAGVAALSFSRME